MIFDERAYTVLVVSSSDKFNQFIKPLLSEAVYSRVTYASNAAQANRKLLEGTYDFVIINAPLSDDFGTKLATYSVHNRNTMCLMLVSSQLHDEIHAEVVGSGVFTMAKPMNAQMMEHAFKWMAAGVERLKGLKKENRSVEDKMNEIKLINRAKWRLIENMRMTEAEAHRYIEKQAMDYCITRREVAERVLRDSES